MARSRRRRSGRAASLTRRGKALVAVGVVSLVVAYAISMREIIYVAGLMLLLPFIAGLLARFRRLNLEVTRTFLPAVAAVGEPVIVELAVFNLAAIPTPHLTWHDSRPWSGGDHSGLLPPLTPRRGRLTSQGSVARVRYQLVAPRRGVYEIGPLSVVLADPFGLATAEVAVGAVDRLIVTPHLVDLPDTGLAVLASDGASMLVRRAVGGDDDLSTREYRTGDALRRVHWRATARHGDLMVRQEEPRSHAEARVILDTRFGGYSDIQPIRHRDDPESDSFELAMSLASSIALHLARGGFEVEVVETGHRQLEPLATIEPFLETLATIQLSPEYGPYPTEPALDPFTRPDSANGSVFAVVADADAATVERLAAQPASFDLAVAFVISPRDGPVIERLAKAGWTCVPMRLEDSVEGIWRVASDLHGARHGR